MSGKSGRDHEKIAGTILVCLRQSSLKTEGDNSVSILVAGTLEASAEQILSDELSAVTTSFQCVRAFRSQEEIDSWKTRFGSMAPAVRTLLLSLEEDVLQQGLQIGEFDLITVIGADHLSGAKGEILANLKRLLKKNAFLLLENGIGSTTDWKGAFARAGFDGVKARSDSRSNGATTTHDLLIARSDGQVRVQFPREVGLPGTLEKRTEKPIVSNERNGTKIVRSSAGSNGTLRPTIAREGIREIIIKTLEEILQLSSGDLDPNSPFTEFGVDSIAGVRFVNELNRHLTGADLKPTILFDYSSVEKLATYLAAQNESRTPERTPPASHESSLKGFIGEQEVIGNNHDSSQSQKTKLASVDVLATDIAVIGMSGRFPGAENVEQFWQNLAAGKDCITEVPPERWDHRRFYEAGSRQTNKTNSNWGGFITDADKFDPLFFSISGREAETTDPQHRLFLEESYHALEDAGYAGPSTRLVKKCGVYAGVEPGDYLHLLMALRGQKENAPVFQGNAESILAARISYFLDLKGPSIAINTACSSSLVAIHLACQSLITGECDLALAGGVRVIASERAHLALSSMGMLSPEGRCKTFDEAANGFVPGEAVGVLVLKSLVAALTDGDHVYGVIKGSAINQDGRTNGITAPSSLSQTAVELEVYKKFGLNPETFQCVEAHGTGTVLGDPIEIEALTQAFRRYTPENGSCAIGSVKTNIGHTMAAAGVCSVIKVLLSLQHNQIAPSLHLNKTNPYIDFENSPFFVNTELRDWRPTSDGPRRAAISSFGFSGTNSHLVIEEAREGDWKVRETEQRKPAYLITLSAKTAEGLQQSTARLANWLQGKGNQAGIEAISFTLNAGRGHFEYRYAIVANSVDELLATLRRSLKGEAIPNAWRSSDAKRNQDETAIFRQLLGTLLKELPEAVRQGATFYREKLAALAALYVRGYDLDVMALHLGEVHRRIPMPTYPFSRERYWISETETTPHPMTQTGFSCLHPLVHRNVSTVTQTVFASSLDPDAFFLRDHRVRGEKILPGVAYLELAAAAARMAKVGAEFGLANVTWIRPLNERLAKNLTIRFDREDERFRFEIVSQEDQSVHAQGKIVLGRTVESPSQDITSIRARCRQTEFPEAIYERCAEIGLDLGEGFRTIKAVWFGEDEALSRLELPSELVSGAADFLLHPGLMDGALQTTAVLGRGEGGGLPVPFAVGEVRFKQLGVACYAHVRRASEENDLLRFEVNLLDETGGVLVELKSLTMRILRPETTADPQEPVYIRPIWVEKLRIHRDPVSLTGRLLLLDSGEDLANGIRRYLPNFDVVRAVQAPEYTENNCVIGLRADRPEDFERLLRSARPDFIVHRWEPLSVSDAEAVDQIILPLFHLTQEMIRAGVNSQTKLLFLHLPGASPGFSAVAGYARTLRLERPNLHLKVLETERIDVPRLIDELLNFDRDTEVRDRDGRRSVKELEIFEPSTTNPVPLRNHGVYLISGGLGGLGQIFGRFLAKEYKARLILLGRSGLTPTSQTYLDELVALGAEPIYLQTDLTREEDVLRALDVGRSRFGALDGLIHAAGIIRDGFILNKSSDDFTAVIASKIRGALFLDEATRGEKLDFFALFSSLASVLGNVGQGDYAYANCFLDEFARAREAKWIRGERYGRTISVNWPLWRQGGMQQSADFERLKLTRAGLVALESKTGLEIFQKALQLGEPQVMVLVGQLEKVRSLITKTQRDEALESKQLTTPLIGSKAPLATSSANLSSESSEQVGAVSAATLRYLTEQFSRQVKIPGSRIRASDPLEQYGLDSIMVMEFTELLEKDFGELPKTLLFECQTLEELVSYFVGNHLQRLQELLDLPPVLMNERREMLVVNQGAVIPDIPTAVETRVDPPLRSSSSEDQIAIIGVFGRYPMADDLEQYWDNLRSGKDCIIEIPRERWDYRLFYSDEPWKREPGKPGKTANKWGGFLNEVERFDPQFFNITPREAYAIDPQERLFLETVWRTVEDAGYRKSALVNRKVGVFVGVMYGEYQLYGAGEIAEGWGYPLSSSYASIANRVSYFFNWHGPSMAIDTMCSSSLTSIHLACQSLRRGESELAIAGGVNTTLHPHKDLLLNLGGFTASDGRCHSFGEGGDGYVPGEGVGAVLLKPLARAIADGDHIHGVLLASTVNHGGKTNGYTVPNPKAQAELIFDALTEGKVDPRSISYIEAHGTGTTLGDPIEITALTKTFREIAPSVELHSCAIGSAKSNIGHLESAAGIAGLTKVLLQMQSGQVAPSLLHSENLNPNINFADSIFYVPQKLQSWDPTPFDGDAGIRRAGVSSFGAGGSNAHVILEQYHAKKRHDASDVSAPGPYLFLLSARTEDRLNARATQLLDYLRRPEKTLPPLTDIVYTLQVGREPLEERLAFVANDLQEAIQRLTQFITGEPGAELRRGSFRKDDPDAESLLEGEEGSAFLDILLHQRKWRKLAQFWVSGGQIEWEQLYRGSDAHRVSLPSYPFAGERYWAPEKLIKPKKEISESRLHPLIHRNVSNFERLSFLTQLEPDDVSGSIEHRTKLLSGLWLIEMGAVAAGLSAQSPVHRVTDVKWGAPQTVVEPLGLQTTVSAEGESIRFEIRLDEPDGVILAQGISSPDVIASATTQELGAIRERCTRGIAVDQFNHRLITAGVFPEGVQSICREMWSGDREVLIRFQRSTSADGRFSACTLDPLLLDLALEAAQMLDDEATATRFAPVSLGSCEWGTLPLEGWCHLMVRSGHEEERTIDLNILDLEAVSRAKLIDLAVRPFQMGNLSEPFYLRPIWQDRPHPEPDFEKLTGRLLLFDSEATLELAIRNRNPGLSITRVIPGESYNRSEGPVQINPRAEDDYKRLAEEFHPEFVIHRWAAYPAPLEKSMELGIQSVFRLTRVLMPPQSEIRILFIHGSSADPALQAVGAFAKTLVQEQPQLQLRVLRTDEADADLLSEFFAQPDEREISRDKSKRQIRGFEIFKPKTIPAVPLRQNGVYWLTGGLGGVGQVFAEYLAAHYQARLVLTGRSRLTGENQAKISDIEKLGGQVLYLASDIARPEAASEVVREARERFGGLHGVIHSAGVLRDSFIFKKAPEDLAAVCAPKILGAMALDEATKHEALDFMVFFSSAAGVFGNVGQADYSYANAFLDGFAAQREARRSAGERQGKTISINWPMWKDRGMALKWQNIDEQFEKIGLTPLSRKNGIKLFEMALRAEEPQLITLWGFPKRFASFLNGASTVEDNAETDAAPPDVDLMDLSQKVDAYLHETLADITQTPINQLNSDQRFEEIGVDSIDIGEFNVRLERDLGPIPKTLLFEHPNIRQLTRHLVTAFSRPLARLFGNGLAASRQDAPAARTRWDDLRPLSQPESLHLTSKAIDEIAIVGLSGRYPKADNLRAFWEILKAGTDCVTEIPKERWDIDQYYDPDPNHAPNGKIYSRWGAFLNDVDKFDPLFFNISPAEAELIDPQERLFLETAWRTLEDAGYTRRDLSRSVRKEYNANVGVFVGVTTNTYSIVVREKCGDRAAALTLPWSLANRVSYLFNFGGPSIPVDTACSSSLTAIHLACEAIRNGQCQQALAGGVNLYLHPSKYVNLCLSRMLSTDGKCRSFGAGGDGFVPGEGVGAVFLKPLSLAIGDGDHIYGVIKGTAVNHGGRTNGYTVPNPGAQAELVAEAFRRSRIDPRTVSYIEAHGTGTALGDPIEVNGLAKAFANGHQETALNTVCALGSIKSNIGHLEAAAGIAGLTKVLLQMKHRQLAPSLHADKLNPNIAFASTPFHVQTKLEEWREIELDGKPCPRRAGISSFGAGGANAHLVVEEFICAPAEGRGRGASESPVLIVLSARNRDRLKKIAANLQDFLGSISDLQPLLPSVAYTLQIGREALDERVAFVTATRADFLLKLTQIAEGKTEEILSGRVKRDKVQIGAEADDFDPDPAVVEALEKHDLLSLGALWVAGALIEWRNLKSDSHLARRLSLPGYPFAAERYWAPDLLGPLNDPSRTDSLPAAATNYDLHPWLHRELPTEQGHEYRTHFTGEEIVLRDHRAGGQSVFPGAASLELALAAAIRTLDESQIRLRQIVWVRALVPDADGLKVNLHLRSEGNGRLTFEIRGRDGAVHVQGKAEAFFSSTAGSVGLPEIRTRCSKKIDPEKLYDGFSEKGLDYGPGFRTIKEIQCSETEVLSLLETPATWGDEPFRLHPALLDGALQSLAAIGAGTNGLELPFAVDEVQSFAVLPKLCFAHGLLEQENHGPRKYLVQLLNSDGQIFARLTGFSFRSVEQPTGELKYFKPAWNSKDVSSEKVTRKSVLLLDEGTEFAAALEDQGLLALRVIPGEEYERSGNLVSIRLGRIEDYHRLVGEVSFDAVVHCWSKARLGLDESLERSLYSVHKLAGALMQRAKPASCLYIYPIGEPAYEAVSGYAKSLNQEQKSVRLKTVGLDGVPANLVAELDDAEVDVRYHQGKRGVLTLKDWSAQIGDLQNPLRMGGNYLVTGGAGGLGRIFAEHLMQAYDARLLLVGRSPLNEAARHELIQFGDRALYLTADVSTQRGASQAVQAAKERFGILNGILHAAGELRDGWVRNKTREEMAAVLAAKVFGVEALDAATCNEALDCFILFSSTAALFGNAGQSDYAYANAYLDSFALRRENQRLAGLRFGRTISLNWPLWLNGGMRASSETVQFQAQTLGLRPLETSQGLKAFTHIISSGEIRGAVFYGAPQKLIARLEAEPNRESERAAPATRIEVVELKTPLLSDLKKLAAKVLRLDVDLIEADVETSEYGFDSISFTALANEVNGAFGFEVTPALLFEYPTLDSFSDFLVREYADKLAGRYKPIEQVPLSPTPLPGWQAPPIEIEKLGPVHTNGQGALTNNNRSLRRNEPVAIVGMSGVFPGSRDLDEFWNNLEQGRDLISRAPKERWDFAPATGSNSAQSKEPPWGGFIPDIDKFDPLFFEISPREAELMDPQQRLFLQVVWRTLEDAGYKKSDLAGSKTGVFVGVAANDYGHLLAMHQVAVEAYSSTGNAHSVLANRVSFFFDLYGPSEAIDTACSSSLVAIHRAVESMAMGSSDMAVVGGVNVLLSPGAFLAFGKAGMLCADGRCKTFDATADGYVRGEGVGAILLKPLSRAQADGDHIYGVILGSAENHGGHVQSLTVPNPNAQARLLQDAYARAGIDPFTVSYIEAHGTGTSLGDPIEINGLKKAFGQNKTTVAEPRCAVGSVKTNIGHLETAAGIAGVIKSLLSMRHARIPGNVHLRELNPYIQVSGTPFYFPQKTEPWQRLRDHLAREIPRRAGISSFGFGGANAHILIEEYIDPDELSIGLPTVEEPELFVFSATDSIRLREIVSNFVAHLGRIGTGPNFVPSQEFRRIAYTLQVGREAMIERLAVVAVDFQDLAVRLGHFMTGEEADLFRGSAMEGKASLQMLRQVHENDEFLEPLLQKRQLAKLARLWVNGLEIPWKGLWPSSGMRRTRLPGYAFEQGRYWVPSGVAMAETPSSSIAARLHPLLHSNESTLRAQLYGSRFSYDDVVLKDHQVDGQMVLPGAASLEMLVAGAGFALENQNIRLRRIVWVRPIVAAEKDVELKLELRPAKEGLADLFLRTSAGEVFVQGKAELGTESELVMLDLNAIRLRCENVLPVAELYTEYAKRGLNYGPAFRPLQEVRYGSEEVLSDMRIPGAWEESGYRLHPSLIDGALQSLAAIRAEQLLELPFAIEEVNCWEALPPHCLAYGQVETDQGGARRYGVWLLDESGKALAHLKGLTVRPFARREQEVLYFNPAWTPKPLEIADRTVISGPVLLFDESPERARMLGGLGVSTIRVLPGEAYESNHELVKIRPERAEDYARLVQEFGFSAIIHCWSEAKSSLDAALKRGIYSLHGLVQALLRSGRLPPMTYLYPPGEAAYEAVNGYSRSLRQEQPKLRLQTIGVEADAPFDLVAELTSADLEVRHGIGSREVRTIKELPVTATIESNLRRGGAYIVTGGAGGLGLIFAEYLIHRYEARLVLVGRSELNEAKREEIGALGENVVYLQADVSEAEDVGRVIGETKQRYGGVDGVIHAAGVLRDGLIWSKTLEDFEDVLAAKVRAVEELDLATRDEPLGCFILFSSTAALFGNPGQSDYAYANAYLDSFAHRREELRRHGQRSGRTLSLNWPLWRDGGMQGPVNNSRAEALGMAPLEKGAGLRIFEGALASGQAQVWGCVGSREKIGAQLLEHSSRDSSGKDVPRPPSSEVGPRDLEIRREAIDYLVREFAALTRMDPRQIAPREPLEKYGFDSIMAVEFSQQLEHDFGELSKTLLFEYSSLEALAGYFLEHHAERLIIAAEGNSRPAAIARPEKTVVRPEAEKPARFIVEEQSFESDDGIAVIGLAGRYPQAENLDEFWANLVAGKDCIEEIPAERWDYRQYFDPQPGKRGRSFNKWGGFLRDVDKFDPLFFNVSPREAEIIDPQERLFLETVWKTVEDAGYSRSALSGHKIGVFVGVMYGQYQLFGVEESLRSGEVLNLSSSYASIANRVSNIFDWKGPSMALDTMCSSSLMSIHLACESLKRGESEMAVAGGVNLILHPHKDVGLSQAGFLNQEGRCRSFGETKGRGYVPGEGVGSVLLKPLRAAVRDRDHIYGVIKATAVNHNGKTNGYAPNPNAQAEVISEGLSRSGIDPRTISYVEAAATGSALGDQVEISGLSKAFAVGTEDRQYCAIGSVKSNIGHLEAASGIAGLTKVLLQLRHRKLAPSLHTEKLNPDIRWEQTPFFVQRELTDWDRPPVAGSAPRRACLNAFGAGGSNANLIVEEFAKTSAGNLAASPMHGPAVIVLSARSGEQLLQKISDLVAYLQRDTFDTANPARLLDIAFTLLMGREAMEERIAVLANSLEQVIEMLTLFAAGKRRIPGLYYGRVAKEGEGELRQNGQGIDHSGAPELFAGSHPELYAARWVTGIECGWEKLYGDFKPARVSLPAYPFLRERCWYSAKTSEPDRDVSDQPLVTDVRELLASSLKLSPKQIGLQQRFADFGLDSVTTIGFLNVLEERLHIQVSPAALIDHPTLESFVSFLLNHHRAQAEASTSRASTLSKVSFDPRNGTNGFTDDHAPTHSPLAAGTLRKLALAPLDYVFVGEDRLAIQVLYHFGNPLDFDHLRLALHRVAEAFYPINSRLVREDGIIEYSFEECADPPDFEEIICGPDIGPPRQEAPDSLTPFHVGFNPASLGAKLAQFRLFQIESGSVLSVNVSHAIADGYSFYYFLSSWAAACRGELYLRPDHSRSRLTLLAGSFREKYGSLNGGGAIDLSFPLLESGVDSITCNVETLRFDGASLVKEARTSVDPEARDKITENSLVTALVWQTYARALPAEIEEVALACPIDFRLISPELSRSFFGNASVPAIVRLKREQVLSMPVPSLAAVISEAIRTCDETTLARYCAAIDELRRSHGLETIGRTGLVNPRSGLIVTNVARFPLPPIDFGTGPFLQEFTPTNYPGTAVILREAGSTLKVRLCYRDSLVSR